jgi:preprotein translocase subunit SecE
MNRETKRMMARQGTDQPRTPEQRRQAATSAPRRERIGPRKYLDEVRGEMRQVAWPDRQEVVNSTIVVLITVVLITALIFGLDTGFAKFVLFLFK